MHGIYGLDEQLLASQERLHQPATLIGTVFSHDAQLVSEPNIDGKPFGLLTSLAFLTSCADSGDSWLVVNSSLHFVWPSLG
jgi:hypothetical protein